MLVVMSKLSSTALFHFTHSYDVLLKILEDGFWARYCVERGWGGKDLLIPMICTCDIPLSNISFHQKKYGKYGVGVKKKWAKSKGFTPVLYVSDKSNIFQLLSNWVKRCTDRDIMPSRKILDEKYLLRYAKRVKGTKRDKDYLKVDSNPKFSNEHEWRFVPLNFPMRFVCEGKKCESERFELSKLTEYKKLKLTLDDIEYIFVEKESERDAIIKKIHELFDDKGLDVVDVLISKVNSSEQMAKDF